MISKDRIQKILEVAVQAPSGSNSQPWRFEVARDTISVIMLPEKDHPVLNYRNRGTLVANGALVENILVAAAHYGLRADLKLFPKEGDPKRIAEISVREGGGNGGPDLFGAIEKRTTNRKPYQAKKISEEAKQALVAVPAELGEYDIVLKLTTDRDAIVALARAASANEVVTLEEKDLHHLFFDEIVWTEKEEKEKKSGLYVKTMELAPPQEVALRALRHWPVMSFFGALGVARGIAKSNAKGYMACGAYGAILCSDRDEDFVKVGMVMERAWLKATALGMCFHLQTGTNFFYQNLMAGAHPFSLRHEKLIRDQYEAIAKVFAAGDKLVPITFRLGYDGEPTARSSKKVPEITFA